MNCFSKQQLTLLQKFRKYFIGKRFLTIVNQFTVYHVIHCEFKNNIAEKYPTQTNCLSVLNTLINKIKLK